MPLAASQAPPQICAHTAFLPLLPVQVCKACCNISECVASKAMAKVFGRKRKSVSLQEIVPNLSLLRMMAKRNLVQRRKKRRKRLRKRKNSNRE